MPQSAAIVQGPVMNRGKKQAANINPLKRPAAQKYSEVLIEIAYKSVAYREPGLLTLAQ